MARPPRPRDARKDLLQPIQLPLPAERDLPPSLPGRMALAKKLQREGCSALICEWAPRLHFRKAGERCI